MKAASVLLLTILSVGFSQAQTDDGLSPATQRYFAFRRSITEPKYGLAKVKALIKKIKRDSDDNYKISEKDFKKLTIKEKFTYVMLHAEDFSQNCDAMPPVPNEEKLIVSHPPDAFDEMSWSERQTAFLTDNRSTVLQLLRAEFKSRTHIGLNLKKCVLQINGTELVPELLASFQADKRDHDLLAVLMVLMVSNKYSPFVSSEIGKTLYGENSNYRTTIEASESNVKYILTSAADFYHKRH